MSTAVRNPDDTWDWVDDETGQFLGPCSLCPECHDPIEGATWNGRCFDCHEASLLPSSQWGWDGTPWDDEDPSARPFEGVWR